MIQNGRKKSITNTSKQIAVQDWINCLQRDHCHCTEPLHNKPYFSSSKCPNTPPWLLLSEDYKQTPRSFDSQENIIYPTFLFTSIFYHI